MTKLIRFQVIGEERMHCASCEARVVLGLRRLAGVRDVHASAQTQQISVSVDSGPVTSEQLQEKLLELGYRAEPVARDH